MRYVKVVSTTHGYDGASDENQDGKACGFAAKSCYARAE
jgi:hypothetical protein